MAGENKLTEVESVETRFVFNGTAEQLLASLDQSIYSTNPQAAKYESGNVAELANLPPFIIAYIRRDQQQWGGLAVDELLSLFNNGVLEHWEYIGQNPLTPDVVNITLIDRENASNEQIFPPHDYLWQPNQPVFALRVQLQDDVFHLSLLPLGYRFGLSQIIRRIVYRAIRRDITTGVAVTGRYAGVATQWQNIEFFIGIEFDLNPTVGGKTPVTMKCHSLFKPMLDRILSSLGDTMNDESAQTGNIFGGTVNQANFHGPVTGPVHTGSGNIYMNPPPSAQIFTNVWYLAKEYRWWQWRNPDVGTLELQPQQVQFRGRSHEVRMSKLQSITHGHQPGDLNNNWVKVSYLDEKGHARLAFFADAKRLGIGNLVGGSDAIFQALHAWQKQ